MNILFVTYGLPYPPDSGVRIHDFNLIKNISGHHQVHLLSLITDNKQIEHVPQLGKYCQSVDYVIADGRSIQENISGVFRTLLSHRPLATHPYYYQEMAHKIRKVVVNNDIDVVQIEHSFLASYVDAIPKELGCKKVLSFHNFGEIQYRRMVHLKNSLKEKMLFNLKSFLMSNWEKSYAEKFDSCLVVSPVERNLLLSQNLNLSVSVIENGVDTEFYQLLEHAPDKNTLLFVGVMGYPPNVDAVLYFYEDIMRLIQNHIPNIKLTVVGHDPAPEIRRLAQQKNIVVTGYVPDVIPYYQKSQVTIVPLRGGGGTRLKILESMALGRPVVSTTLGCEGLEVTDRANIMIADTPSEFAECVIQLFSDTDLKNKIASNARRLVETHYDWKMISRKLMTIYDNM